MKHLSVFLFIETNVESGTMHTVQFTLDQDRLLFCPDLRKSPKYDLTVKQCQGILMLLEQKKAEPYLRTDYDSIIKKLKNKLNNLLFTNADNDLPSQGDLFS